MSGTIPNPNHSTHIPSPSQTPPITQAGTSTQPRPEVPAKDPPIVELRPLADGEKVGDDVSVIVLIGPTGTGKSNFVEKLGSKTTRWDKVKDLSKSKLDAGTTKVFGYRVEHKHLNIYTTKPLIIVDTPGLSDRRKSEMQVLGQIKKWMKARGVKSVDRLFYMDRISDNRMPRSKTKSLEIFKALCGTEAASRTVVVTTMWDLMWNERLAEHSVHRFGLLTTQHWNDFIAQGSRIEKFDNTFEAAVRNLQALGPPMEHTGPAFAFEKDVGMKETEMGRRAFQVLTERYENLDVSLQVVEQDIIHSQGMNNKELDGLLLKQKNEIKDDLKEVTQELEDYSPEYKPFRDRVHAELDRPISPESTTTTGTTQRGGFKAKLEGWLNKLKEFTGGIKGKSKTTPYSPPLSLPNIHEFTETGRLTGGDSSSSNPPPVPHPPPQAQNSKTYA